MADFHYIVVPRQRAIEIEAKLLGESIELGRMYDAVMTLYRLAVPEHDADKPKNLLIEHIRKQHYTTRTQIAAIQKQLANNIMQEITVWVS